METFNDVLVIIGSSFVFRGLKIISLYLNLKKQTAIALTQQSKKRRSRAHDSALWAISRGCPKTGSHILLVISHHTVWNFLHFLNSSWRRFLTMTSWKVDSVLLERDMISWSRKCRFIMQILALQNFGQGFKNNLTSCFWLFYWSLF